MKENTESLHKTVLLKETIEGLTLANDSLVLDATFGGGGHSLLVLEKYKKTKVVALDQDGGAWNRAKDKFKDFSERIIFKNLNFREIDSLTDRFNGVIFDLGLSSDQLEMSGRGFSFMAGNEPLQMTIKENPGSEDLTAEDIVNDWSEESLKNILFGYGEEKFAKRIAKGIVETRKSGRIRKVSDLLSIIERSVPFFYRKGKIHPATKTFQALRIAVNDELKTLEEGLEKAFANVKSRGRMAVISFHSLEDRIVKNFSRMKKKDGVANIINKKPIIPSKEEIKENPRSRSAKLRILEKV